MKSTTLTKDYFNQSANVCMKRNFFATCFYTIKHKSIIEEKNFVEV